MTSTTTIKMPTEMEQVFDELHNDLCHLWLEWKLFRELFATTQERLELLNKTGGSLFSKLFGILQDSVYLGITRMTDPGGSKKRRSVTLKQLLETMVGQDSELYSRARVAVDHAQKMCNPFREDRNKRIAHSDLDMALKGKFIRPSRQTVEMALNSINEVMNVIHTFYNKIEYRYGDILFSKGGNSLECYLKAGVYFHNLRKEVALGKLTGDALANEIRSYSL
jgi:hypothetical protein